MTADDRAFLDRQRRALRVLQIVLGLLAILAIVLIGWQVRAWWQRAAARRAASASAPASTAAVAPPDAQTPAGTSAAESSPAASASPGAGGTVVPVSTTSGAETPAPLTPAGTAAPPSGPLVLGPNDSLVIELEVTADCWVAVTADGRAAGSELMRAGAKRRFEASRELTFDVGNAGAVNWTINGRPARPFGREGVHVRTRVGRDNAASLLKAP